MIQCLECSHKFKGNLKKKGKPCPNCKKILLHFIYQEDSKMIYSLNELIDLRKQGNNTVIYVNNKLFILCKALVLSIPKNEAKNQKIKNIDDFSSYEAKRVKIDPNSEFWGHCSNLEAWIENDYNTSILHYKLSFPLLNKLSKLGDLKAKKRFKSEIIERISSGRTEILSFFIANNYFSHFSLDEIKTICLDKMIPELIDKFLIFFNKDELVEIFLKTKNPKILMYLVYKMMIEKKDFNNLLSQLSSDEIADLIFTNALINYVADFKRRVSIFKEPAMIKVEGRVNMLNTKFGIVLERIKKAKVKLKLNYESEKIITFGKFIVVVDDNFNANIFRSIEKDLNKNKDINALERILEKFLFQISFNNEEI